MTKYLSLTISILILVLAVGGYFFLYQDIATSITEIESARTEIASVGARDSFAKAAAQFLSETGAERAQLSTFVISPDATASAIELVEGAGKLAGVQATVSSATLEPYDKETHHERLVVTVGAVGSFVAQSNFATVLESLPKGASLDAVHLEVAEKGWYGIYTVTFVKEKSL